MLVLIPIAAWIISFLGWSNFRLPVEFDRLLIVVLAASALACAYPLKKIFTRAKPLTLAGKFFVFVMVLLLWFSAFVPLAIIFNVKFDSSAPEWIERSVLETRPHGPGVCIVKVAEWKSGGADQWLWLDCKEAVKAGAKVRYELRRGALGFAWVSSNASGM